jgi:hypothetical protein
MNLLSFTIFNTIIFVIAAYVGHDTTRSSLLKFEWLNHQKETILDAANEITPTEINKNITFKFPATHTFFSALMCIVTSLVYGALMYMLYIPYELIFSAITGYTIKNPLEEYTAVHFYGIVSWLGFYYGRSSVCRYACIQSYLAHPNDANIQRSPRETALKHLNRIHK